MELASIILFQLRVHCYLKSIQLTEMEEKYTVEMAITGGVWDLKKFCDHVVEKGLSYSTESSRTILDHIETKGLIVKEGHYRKMVKLNPEMGIQVEGTVLVDIKLSNYIANGSKESN